MTAFYCTEKGLQVSKHRNFNPKGNVIFQLTPDVETFQGKAGIQTSTHKVLVLATIQR